MFDNGAHAVLGRDGVRIIVKIPGDEMPQVEYWGRDLGAVGDEGILEALDAMTLKDTPPNRPDAAWRPSLLPQGAEAWAGRPGLEAHRGGAPVFARWTQVGARVFDGADGEGVAVGSGDAARSRIVVGDRLEIVAADAVNRIRLELTLAVRPGGLVTVSRRLTNTDAAAAEPLAVDWLDAVLPVPRRVDTLTQFTGRWPLEKQPATAAMPVGSVTRDCRRGKTGHDSPWMFILSDGAPRWSEGEVWACHLAWSGNQTYRLDNLAAHEPLLGAGELPGPGEIMLAAGESYRAPDVCFAYSDCGLDGVAARFHDWVRAMPGRVDPVAKPRPFTLNTWEAVYFDHDEATLMRLADRAAAIGVERFVLDDGWFHLRRDDSKGLGDWTVDPAVWPNGLDGLARHVHGLGMEFGLWFEPEMVNLESDLYREHPDWVLAAPEAVPCRGDVSYRNQYVLDLANPDAYAHVHGQMAGLIRDLGIDYIKWDHNRDVTEPVHDGRYGLHAQTEACYHLFDQLRGEFPGLEIESCASGGARTDTGMLMHADRVWGSDSNDPRDRIDIQRWTELVVPPEMIGAHVGPSPAHSTGRATDLSYRAAVSLTGCSGFEWNILDCDDDELRSLAAFVALYKELRGLLHTGRVAHADLHDPAWRARGVTDAGRTHAVWTVATVDTLRDALAERLRITGLAPARRYRVRLRTEVGEPRWGWVTPRWLDAARHGGFTVPGRLLGEIGLQLPPLWPLQAMILEFTAE
ncbi:alpha-galactosidase [Bifidobacterium pullorum subsp. gallinarum]|uniref:alpha-galactosidase n=3 Tax=Bifidobacterium pullorum TaxID=78448 RepID=A0A087AM97_9BIFI|nr:alpha-galactosidase [Bifidobacterium pullorum]KFI59897.1 alpha-galactosidase [Bifidobacterium pullorum subsp. gallinarum]